MADSWFVDPETVTISLPGGQWLEVKKRLTVGEERAAFQLVGGEVNGDGWRRPNYELLGLTEVMAYLVNWSITRNGQPIKIDTDGLKIAALKNMRPDKFKIISDAIEAHIATMDAELASEKNGTDGGNGPGPTLPSAA